MLFCKVWAVVSLYDVFLYGFDRFTGSEHATGIDPPYMKDNHEYFLKCFMPQYEAIVR